MMSFFKPPIKYDRKSLEQAAALLTDEERAKTEGYVDVINWDELKKGKTYYVINPDQEDIFRLNDRFKDVRLHYAFVRLLRKTKNDETGEFNVYDYHGEFISERESGNRFSEGDGDLVNTVITLTPNCLFLDADTLLSATQSGGNKRKKHSSNKLSKRRVKAKSRRRNNITHRRKQRR